RGGQTIREQALARAGKHAERRRVNQHVVLVLRGFFEGDGFTIYRSRQRLRALDVTAGYDDTRRRIRKRDSGGSRSAAVTREQNRRTGEPQVAAERLQYAL